MPEDGEAFAAINCNPRVMQFLGPPLTREQSDEFDDRIETVWKSAPSRRTIRKAPHRFRGAGASAKSRRSSWRA